MTSGTLKTYLPRYDDILIRRQYLCIFVTIIKIIRSLTATDSLHSPHCDLQCSRVGIQDAGMSLHSLCDSRVSLCASRVSLCASRVSLLVEPPQLQGDPPWLQSRPRGARVSLVVLGEPRGSRVSLFSCRVSLCGSRVSLFGSRIRFYGNFMSLHGSRVSLHGSRVSPHGPAMRLLCSMVNLQGSMASQNV